jgi:ADP-heptose:LPS heptosyltransferase
MSRLVDKGFNWLLVGLSILLRTFVRPSRGGERTVLLLTLGGIGDYLLLSPVLHCYKAFYADASLVLVGRAVLRELVEASPYVDRFISVDYDKFGGDPAVRVKLCCAIALERAEVLINADYSTVHEWMATALVRWSGAKTRIAFACLDPDAFTSRSEYTQLVYGVDPLMFEIKRHAIMLAQLNIDCDVEMRPQIWGLLNHHLKPSLAEQLSSRDYYVVFPGSYTSKKCWPVIKFVDLIRRLSTLDLLPVIVGGTLDASTATEIEREVDRGLLNLVGHTDLLDLAKVISDARFLVSNDSSAAHVGTAVGTRTFVLLGGGHFGRFFPYPGNSIVEPVIAEEYSECHGCQWHCLYDRFLCIEDIAVVDVERKIRNYLAEQSRS